MLLRPRVPGGTSSVSPSVPATPSAPAAADPAGGATTSTPRVARHARTEQSRRSTGIITFRVGIGGDDGERGGVARGRRGATSVVRLPGLGPVCRASYGESRRGGTGWVAAAAGPAT